MILGIPVINKPELTRDMLDVLNVSVADPDNLTVIIIDNGSEPAYDDLIVDYLLGYKFKIGILSNDDNLGYYYPLKQLQEIFDDEIIALSHNDLFIYEAGWDIRLKQAFEQDEKLGMVGFVGSNEVDTAGGRGSGTMCWFRGERGQSQAAGLRITDLQPSLLLDSVFMAVRNDAIDDLEIDEHIAPCHFYDKIWPMRLTEKGWRVATLGIEVDHMGGMTSVGEIKYDESAQRWCDRENIDTSVNGAGLAVYLEAERRFLDEFRTNKKMIPARIDSNWQVHYGV